MPSPAPLERIEAIEKSFGVKIAGSWQGFGARFYMSHNGRSFQEIKNESGEWVLSETTS